MSERQGEREITWERKREREKENDKVKERERERERERDRERGKERRGGGRGRTFCVICLISPPQKSTRNFSKSPTQLVNTEK